MILKELKSTDDDLRCLETGIYDSKIADLEMGVRQLARPQDTTREYRQPNRLTNQTDASLLALNPFPQL